MRLKRWCSWARGRSKSTPCSIPSSSPNSLPAQLNFRNLPKRNPMQFSHDSLRSYLRKLHLEPGDCLVVSNETVLKQLQRMPAMDFHVPVIFAPDGQGL